MLIPILLKWFFPGMKFPGFHDYIVILYILHTAHGASLLLKERYDSDKIVLNICADCGAIAVEDNIRSRIICPLCSSENAEPVEISYVFKLLLEELQGMHIRSKLKLKNKYE